MSTAVSPPARLAPPAPARPWDRLPTEGDAAWHAFQTYLEMGKPDPATHLPGKRQLSAVSAALGHSSRTGVHEWAGTHNWIERTTAHDQALAEKRAEVIVESVQDIARHHAALARRTTLFVQQQLDRLEEQTKVALPEELSPAQGVAMIRQAIELERLVNGASTSNESHAVTVKSDQPKLDYSLLEPEELRELDRLRRKMRGQS